MRLLVIAALVAMHAGAQTPVNPDAKLVADFQSRLADYLKLHQKVKSQFPLKPTTAPEKISGHKLDFAASLRAARAGARQGDIFSPPIADEFRRLIRIAMTGQRARRVHQSLKHAEPVKIALRVNDVYPSHLPLQSTPPTLLANLPHLPPDLEYRPIGHDMVLLDIDANIIVDFIPQAIP